MRLKDQVAVITGAGSGIGRATALLFAGEGAKIVIAELNERSGSETAELVAKAGGEALAVATDVGDLDSVRRLFAAIDKKGWPVDVLVNNAGNAEPALQPLYEVSDERWHSQLARAFDRHVLLHPRGDAPHDPAQAGRSSISARWPA